MKRLISIISIAGIVLCTVARERTDMSEADARAMAKYPSFATASEHPNGVAYLPAPPDTAGVLFYNDWVQYNRGKALRNTPRGEQARFDANMNRDSIAAGFAPALGFTISREHTPELFKLLNMVINDACKSTEGVKRHYMRKRPFVQFNEGTLIPGEEASHRHTGSFPSSHAAAGWGAALMLVEIFPEHQDAILERGYEYGQSRVIAGYHYQSDVDAARLSASAAIARAHSNPEYAEQVKRVRKELAKLVK